MSRSASVIRGFVKSVIRPVRSAGKVVKIGRTVGSVAPVWSRDFWRLFRRTRRLCRKGSFVPEEVSRRGLLDIRLSEEKVDGVVSKKNMNRILRRLNPTPWAEVTHNKAVTQAFLEGGGIASPKLYAVFCRDTSGWTFEGDFPGTSEQWRRFIDSLPDEFIVKPTQGSLGEGVRLYRRRSDGFVDFEGAEHTSRDIYDVMASDTGYDSYLIQERLRNHEALVKLSGVENLQTIRVVSLIDLSGTVRVVQAVLKIIVGENLTDNFDYGTTGNVEAQICLESGGLKPATGAKTGPITEHPETGVRLEDFEIPYWSDACEMVLRGARLLAPSRAIGWDVAITPTGPVVLEANTWWGPPHIQECLDELIEAASI